MYSKWSLKMDILLRNIRLTRVGSYYPIREHYKVEYFCNFISNCISLYFAR